MSEQKLKKWENKLKLWMALHPKENIVTSNKCEMYCPYSIDHGCKHRRHKNSTVLSIANLKPDVILVNSNRIDYYCVEWIKYA